MSSVVEASRLPIIDLSLFDLGNPWRDHVAAQVDWAAGEFGLFHVVGHGVEPGIAESLRELSAAFYRQQSGNKSGELRTQPGAQLYFGEGLAEDHAHMDSGQPENAYPALPGFREAVLDYMSALTGLAHRLMTSFGRGLRLGDNYFVDRYTSDPATRLRIVHQLGVHHPGAASTGLPDLQGAGGQTDAGLLTLIHQDEIGGFQVRSGSAWVDVPHVPDSFVIAVGDSLERLTSGRYAAAVRRPLNRSTRSGVALQFSFHPRPGASLQSIPLLGSASPVRTRVRSAGERSSNVPTVMPRPENVIGSRF